MRGMQIEHFSFSAKKLLYAGDAQESTLEPY